MFGLHVVLCVVAVFVGSLAKLDLEKGKNETISFSGNELKIQADNSGGLRGDFKICVGASQKNSASKCPEGFDELGLRLNPASVKTFKMTRQGKVVGLDEKVESVLFKDGNALDILLLEVPHSSTKVTLLNAQRYVPPESVESTTEKEAGSATVITVVIVLLIIAVILTAVMFVLIWFCRRTVPSKVQDKDEKQKCKEMNGFGSRRHEFSSPAKSVSRQISSPTVPVSPKRSSSIALAPSEQNTESISPTNAVKQT